MRKYHIAMFTILLASSYSAYASAEKSRSETLHISDDNSCVEISDGFFFRLSRGTATLSYLNEQPKLVSISYVSEEDYHPQIGKIDRITVREQLPEIANNFYKKASLGLKEFSKKASENRIAQSKEKNIFCSSNGKTPGLAEAENIMCYLKTNKGTHTFFMPIQGELSQEVDRIYSKSFSEKPCANVIAIRPTNKRIPASQK